MKSNDAIDRFAAVALDFCRWCEEPAVPESDPAQLSREMRLILARLIAAALELPRTDPEDAPDGERASDLELKALSPRLALLPIDFYGVYFVPSELDSPPVIGSLADDLQDIYRDLKAGLWLYERHHVEAAAWEWYLFFDVHWGHHATNALHALQGHAVQA